MEKVNREGFILIFIDWYLPAFRGGGPIKSVSNLVGHLVGHSEIRIITSPYDYPKILMDVIQNEWLEIEDGVYVFYTSSLYSLIRESYSYMNRIGLKCLYLNSIFSLKFSILPLLIFKMGRVKQRVILSPRGMLQIGALKSRRYIQKVIFLKALSNLKILVDINWHATDTQEHEDIKRFFKGSGILTIPNLPSKRTQPFVEINKQKGLVKLFFLSRISPKKNIEFILEILENNMWSGTIYLDIYGAGDEWYVEEIQQLVNNFRNDNVHINYLGEKHPDIIPDIMVNYHYLILPTKGENYGHVIVESFCVGRPVLISNNTPWQNLEVRKIGYDMSLESQDLWIESIEHIINMSHDEYLESAKAAYKYGVLLMNNDEARYNYSKLFDL